VVVESSKNGTNENGKLHSVVCFFGSFLRKPTPLDNTTELTRDYSITGPKVEVGVVVVGTF